MGKVSEIELELENYAGSSASITEEIVYPKVEYLHKLSHPCQLIGKHFVDPLQWREVVTCNSDIVVVKRKIYDSRFEDRIMISYIAYVNGAKKHIFIPSEIRNIPISMIIIL